MRYDFLPNSCHKGRVRNQSADRLIGLLALAVLVLLPIGQAVAASGSVFAPPEDNQTLNATAEKPEPPIISRLHEPIDRMATAPKAGTNQTQAGIGQVPIDSGPIRILPLRITPKPDSRTKTAVRGAESMRIAPLHIVPTLAAVQERTLTEPIRPETANSPGNGAVPKNATKATAATNGAMKTDTVTNGATVTPLQRVRIARNALPPIPANSTPQSSQTAVQAAPVQAAPVQKVPALQPTQSPALQPALTKRASTSAQSTAPQAQTNATQQAGPTKSPALIAAEARQRELEKLYAAIQTALGKGNLDGANTAVKTMLVYPNLPSGLREELLYTLADITMQQGKNDLKGNFESILSAYEAAKNVNPSSPNLPDALYNIGKLHLAVGNAPEAKGYFDLLRRKHPHDKRLPSIHILWGNHFLQTKNYAQASEQFQSVLQSFPDSSALAAANAGLVKAYVELGFFDKALEIINATEKRWPEHYVDDPAFLMAAGYTAMMTGNLDRARGYFWKYLNLVPQASDADMAMARIGDILMKQGRTNAAMEIYRRAAEAYPVSEGGLIAQMRLAEAGVLGQDDMNAVFQSPEVDPETVYANILMHKDSPLAAVARLKLAMWRLWNKDFKTALEEVNRFQRDYPKHTLLPKALEVADSTLHDWIQADAQAGKFDTALEHWRAYPQYASMPKSQEIADTTLQDWIQADAAQKNLKEALNHWRAFPNYDTLTRSKALADKVLHDWIGADLQAGKFDDALAHAKEFPEHATSPETEKLLNKVLYDWIVTDLQKNAFAAALDHGKKNPKRAARPEIQALLDRVLGDWIMAELKQGAFEAAVQHWSDNKAFFAVQEPSPSLRLAVGMAEMKAGQTQQALDMAKPLVFGSRPYDEYSGPGLDLTLSILLDLQHWPEISALAEQVKAWTLEPNRQRQLDYAVALAYENMNQPAKAEPLWTKLAPDTNLSDTQRGYATYFLGRTALAADRLDQTSLLGQQALELLQKDKNNQQKIKETLDLLIQAADRSSKYQEALAWCLEYDQLIAPTDQDWPAHTYRKALLYKKTGQMDGWRENLNTLRERFPGSLYARMAGSELEGTRLEKAAQKVR